MCRSAVWWWCRSPNYNNTNNFQVVWTDGNNNNNNAYYSAGVRPGFCRYTRLHGVAENRLFSFQVRANRCKRSYTSQGIQSLKLPFDGPTRTLLAWRENVPAPVSCVLGQRRFRRHPTRQLYRGRILFYEQSGTPGSPVSTPQSAATGQEGGQMCRPRPS